jgi:adenine-specific DNA-methyltransferase
MRDMFKGIGISDAALATSAPTMAAPVPSTGTVYTSQVLANAMARKLSDAPAAKWLDPCAGHGAFTRAIVDMGVPAERIIALDLDHRVAVGDNMVAVARGVDFITWSGQTPDRFDRIIMNPPYVALSRVAEVLRSAALNVTTLGGGRLGLKANYWYAFVLASLRVLRPEGGLCAVLPAAYDFADYARGLRTLLPRKFRSFATYRCLEPLFGNVHDGSIVLVAHGFSGDAELPTRVETRVERRSGEDLIRALGEKETSEGTQTVVYSKAFAQHEIPPTQRLGSICSIVLGGVTGDADYFLLTESERRKLGLPITSVRPVVTRARHLAAALIDDAFWQRLRIAGERVWLFSPSPASMQYEGVAAYMGLSVDEGGCHREAFKIRTRDPWYKTPLPRRADAFLSGMSRRGPFLTLRTMPRLTATNTLYVVQFRNARTLDERAAWGVSLLSTYARNQLGERGRLYADGLLKFEPGDLLDLQLPTPPTTAGALGCFERATAAFISDNVSRAAAIADEWLKWRRRRPDPG